MRLLKELLSRRKYIDFSNNAAVSVSERDLKRKITYIRCCVERPENSSNFAGDSDFVCEPYRGAR